MVACLILFDFFFLKMLLFFFLSWIHPFLSLIFYCFFYFNVAPEPPNRSGYQSVTAVKNEATCMVFFLKKL